MSNFTSDMLNMAQITDTLIKDPRVGVSACMFVRLALGRTHKSCMTSRSSTK